VAQLIASSEGHEALLASHRGEVTIVFCDLRGFTAFTESVEPEEVMNVLREYHAALGELIFRYEGTLDRYAGDGVMVLFNAPIPLPDHAKRAVRMAVEMRDLVRKVTDGWTKGGYELGFGIGIAQGFATLGRIGFEGRYDYGAIGNLRTVALVGLNGSIDWCCLPEVDSPAVFAAIVDHGRGGSFRVAPVTVIASSQRYLPLTNILETAFDTPGGRLLVTDFMPLRWDFTSGR
jgi:hypothetical protein